MVFKLDHRVLWEVCTVARCPFDIDKLRVVRPGASAWSPAHLITAAAEVGDVLRRGRGCWWTMNPDSPTQRKDSPWVENQAPRSPEAAGHAYPADLVDLVLRRWHEASATGHTKLIPPRATQLARVLSICYQATLLREEDRPVTFRLALSHPEAFEPAAGPPSGLPGDGCPNCSPTGVMCASSTNSAMRSPAVESCALP
jgi:hypothetical protein